MKAYQIRVFRSDGNLSLQHNEMCADDDGAMEIGRRIASSGHGTPGRLEIWRDEECVYAGIPSEWPFRPARECR